MAGALLATLGMHRVWPRHQGAEEGRMSPRGRAPAHDRNVVELLYAARELRDAVIALHVRQWDTLGLFRPALRDVVDAARTFDTLLAQLRLEAGQ